jgi:hypothetical protein
MVRRDAALHRIIAAAISLATPAAAAAQSTWTTRIDAVREDAKLHAGPFYAKPQLLLKEIGTDSNVFNAAGEQKSDFTMTVAPMFEIWVPVARRALLKTTTGADFVYYAQYEAERSIDPQLTLRAEGYLSRVMLFGETAYLNTRQRPNYEIDIRSRHVEDRLTAGADIAISPRLSVEVAARQLAVKYDADAQFDGTALQRTLNRETDGVHVAVRHQLTSLTTIAARVERLRDRFEFSPVRNSTSQRIMPGVEFRPQALIKGAAWVGYRRFVPEAPNLLPDFQGLVADLSLSYTLLSATTFGVSYRRDLTYSYEEFQPFFIDGSVGASIRRALGRRFDVLVSADRHRYEYQNVVPLDGPALPDRLDTTWRYAGSIGYRLGTDGRVGFGLSYLERTSNTQVFRDYDKLHIGCSMTYGF